MSRDELRDALSKVLIYEGYDSEGGMHASWRCFDKDRYPEPCSCLYDTVTELLKVIDAGGQSWPTPPAGSGGMASDAQMDWVEGQ